MRRYPLTIAAFCLALALPVLTGCGGGGKATEAEKEPGQTAPTAMKMETATVKLADPKGRWTFTAKAKETELAAQDGPYHLKGATGRYEQTGKEPVLMSADRVDVDKKAEQVHLAGSVRVTMGAMMMESDEFDYNLRTGKVVARGQPKLTLTRDATGGAKPRAGLPGETR
jgi:lipopolysaccharide assembly outer membrane protein LptD (OstA)